MDCLFKIFLTFYLFFVPIENFSLMLSIYIYKEVDLFSISISP